jgi:hypothetical protein
VERVGAYEEILGIDGVAMDRHNVGEGIWCSTQDDKTQKEKERKGRETKPVLYRTRKKRGYCASGKSDIVELLKRLENEQCRSRTSSSASSAQLAT